MKLKFRLSYTETSEAANESLIDSPELSTTNQPCNLYPNRPGGQGASADIHICFQKDGKWGEPVNLGAGVNSTFLENAPSLAPAGKTLYFASMRPKVMTFPKVKEDKNAVLKRLRAAENGSRNIWQVDISAFINR